MCQLLGGAGQDDTKSAPPLVVRGYHDMNTKRSARETYSRLPCTHARNVKCDFRGVREAPHVLLSWHTHVSIMSLNRSLVGASKNINRSADGANSRKDAANVTSCAGLMPTAIPRHKSPAPGAPSTPPSVLATPSLSAGRGPCDDATGGLPIGGYALRPRIPGRAPFSCISRAEMLTFKKSLIHRTGIN